MTESCCDNVNLNDTSSAVVELNRADQSVTQVNEDSITVSVDADTQLIVLNEVSTVVEIEANSIHSIPIDETVHPFLFAGF